MTSRETPPPLDALGRGEGGSYEDWLQQLLLLAREEQAEWLVDQCSGTHRPAFEQGRSPLEELRTLQDMAVWRGCGCGGG